MALRPRAFATTTLLALLVSAAVGVAAGVGGFAFVYAKGGSYMTDDPTACANCHVMNEQYDGWVKSSHKNVAVCNDCHTPPGFVNKYFTKALNGWHHSSAFTTGNFPEPIQITKRNRDVTEKACRKCHEDIVDQVNGGYPHAEARSCVRCHSQVGHLE